MKTLENYFFNQKKSLGLEKWHHYFDIYERHFNRYVNKKPIVLEIGVQRGGSLCMWNEYFGDGCTIYGIDISPECMNIHKTLGLDNIHVEIGDQGDPVFWDRYLANKPKFDIVIDDGGHTCRQQIVTFEKIYDHIDKDGVYLCEDLHTSYWPNFGGGLNKKGSFIEYSKKFIDLLHAFHILNKERSKISKRKTLPLDFRKKTNSIHYYDSIIVLEKKADDVGPQRSVQS